MNIFIGSSSSDNLEEKYYTSCEKLLNQIFKEENNLVFGASNTRLMGLSYKIAKKNNKKVIGICPKIYKDDFSKLNCDKEIITNTVNERTTELINQSDILIFLPGGIGTIYELLSAIESKRSHEHNKPIIIYNLDNYFDKFLSTLDKIYKEKFTSQKVKDSYVICNKEEEVLKYINIK